MRSFIKYIQVAVVFFLLSCGTAHTQRVVQQLDSLYLDHSFFAMDSVYQAGKNGLPDKYKLYFEGILDNAFNRPQASNQKLETLLQKHASLLDNDRLRNVYQAKLSNHTNLYEYSQAHATAEKIITYTNRKKDAAFRRDFVNAASIWRALRSVPPQKIHKDKDYHLQLKRDKVGLLNIPVATGDTTISMIFDTGANFSVMQRSVAQRLGLPIIHSGAYVNSSTGASVKSDFAVMKRIDMGGLVLENVVFLITDDMDLSFPQINYTISGIIGYPVIRAFEEFHLDKNEMLFIPRKAGTYSYNNLAIDNLTPIVKAVHNNKALIFHLDIGATNTELYRLFYDENKDEVQKNFRVRTFNAGGAGGVSSSRAYEVSRFDMRIGKATATLNRVKLSTSNIKQGDEYYHGNLGLDYMRKFSRMVVSFKDASIFFE